MRLRILVGGLALALGLALYAGIVMAIAARLPENALLAFGFYALAGFAWLVPGSYLTRWMLRAPPYRPPPAG
ncbi:MAG TPA: DUF2842 domain-containing protein [Stellaceae bacterium]|nr:DUF2842 domain-containing protein [Stellaceae bacterium]